VVPPNKQFLRIHTISQVMHNVYYVIFNTGNPLALCLNNATDAIAESE
jgi:hypothetical protein